MPTFHRGRMFTILISTLRGAEGAAGVHVIYAYSLMACKRHSRLPFQLCMGVLSICRAIFELINPATIIY